jgi:cytoskeletal protein CcmA (bactofilin family)
MLTNKDMQRVPSATPNLTPLVERKSSYLGPSLLIKGEITGHEDLNLDSKVDGLVSVGGFRLMLGTGARVSGDVVAREAVILGEVAGNISAVDRIEVRKGASIMGDLKTGKIVIEEGAYFKGAVEIDHHNAKIGKDLDTLLRDAKKAEEKHS